MQNRFEILIKNGIHAGNTIFGFIYYRLFGLGLVIEIFRYTAEHRFDKRRRITHTEDLRDLFENEMPEISTNSPAFSIMRMHIADQFWETLPEPPRLEYACAISSKAPARIASPEFFVVRRSWPNT